MRWGRTGLVGLARPELALDRDGPEERREVEPLDLVALLVGVTVGRQREGQAGVGRTKGAFLTPSGVARSVLGTGEGPT